MASGNPIVERKSTKIEGKKVSYLESGKGKPLIMLHAWPMCSDMYKPLIFYLTGSRKILAPDLPGFGESDLLDEYHSYNVLADHVAKFMNNLGIARSDMLGVSFGAGVGLVFASKYPNKIDKLVLNSPPIYFMPHLSNFQKNTLHLSDKLPKIKETIFKGLTSGNSIAFRLLWGEGSNLKEEPFRSIFSQAKKMKLKAIDDTLHEIVNTDFRNMLVNIKVPVLMLIGSEDKNFMPDFNLAIESISASSKTHILDGGNHIMVATKAKEYAAILNEYLD